MPRRLAYPTDGGDAVKRAGNNLWLGALGRLFDHGRAQEEGWHMLAKTERRIAIVIVSATG